MTRLELARGKRLGNYQAYRLTSAQETSSLAFRMVCPKCNTYDYSITRDRRAYAHGGEAADLIYSCRCGKRLFGDQVLKEYERQKKEWQSDTSAREAEEAERQRSAEEREQREAQMREAMAYRARIRAEREHEERMRREEEMRRWRERVEASGGKAPPPPPETPRRAAVQPPSAVGRSKTSKKAAPSTSKTKAKTTPVETEAPAPAPAAAAPKPKSKPKSSKKSSKAAKELAPCAWEECDKPSRSNSKYCSRECSNKNARARHRRRKAASKSS